MIEWVMPQSAHWEMSFFFWYGNMLAHVRLCALTHTRTHAQSDEINHSTPHRDDCLLSLSGCAFYFFFLSLSPAMETSSWEIEQFLIENSAGN